jgi:hypothetical protein
MLHDLSLTLRALLTQKNLPTELTTAQIVFDRPSDNFNPAQTSVDLFLYDLRENVELRSNEPGSERRDDEVIIRPPPLRMACSYLLTAWPIGGEEVALQEQRLLSQVLLTLRRYPTIPSEFLQGSLKDQTPPLPMLTAQVDGLQASHEFWTAVGNKLRPSLVVTVTISMDLVEPAPVTARIVNLHEMHLGEITNSPDRNTEPASILRAFTIGGRILEKDQRPAPGVTVTLVERNLTAQVDSEGRYTLRKVLPGTCTLRVQRGGATVKDVSVTIPAKRGEGYNVLLT